MGCATSKKKQAVCRNCQTPIAKSCPMLVYHPPQREGDTCHVVALTSSTLGSLNLDSVKIMEDCLIKEDFTNVIESRIRPEMIEEMIPKAVPRTPVRTPSGEYETINVWEMMEGLEENSPIRPPRHHHRSLSSQLSKLEENGDDFLNTRNLAFDSTDEEKRVIDCNLNRFNSKPRDRVILYFTSLRGVRKTYEDCCHVRVILKGIGVRTDDRDISMHSLYKEELKELLGKEYFSKGLGLPRVFVGEKYIGGADEIRRLHEEGKLEKLLEGCEMDDNGSGVCDACGDVRFVPCDTCSGSCKIYHHDEDEDEQFVEGHFGFQRCPDCNENGVVRCPICCD